MNASKHFGWHAINQLHKYHSSLFGPCSLKPHSLNFYSKIHQFGTNSNTEHYSKD